MFRKIFNRNAIPVIFIIIGLFAITLGIWGNLVPEWKEAWLTLGKTTLASGVFAGILKLMQVSGVFKEELEKLIFEPRFLKNRNDIPAYWDKLTQELFKNKFPNINTKILKDIKELYLPTKDMVYYDEQEHFLEMRLDATGTLTVKHQTTLSLVCTGEKDTVNYEFQNAMTFEKNVDEISYVCNYIKINGATLSPEEYKHECSTKEKKHINKFTIKLSGKQKYEIEREEIRTYPILVDDILQFRAAKLTNTLIVSVNHTPNLDIQFYKTGEINNFVTKQSSATFKKYEYKGIIYKEQGYLIHLKNIAGVQ